MLSPEDQKKARMSTKNISPLIAAVISHRYASMRELETYYSYEDMLNFLEIIAVDAYNEYQDQRESNYRAQQRR